VSIPYSVINLNKYIPVGKLSVEYSSSLPAFFTTILSTSIPAEFKISICSVELIKVFHLMVNISDTGLGDTSIDNLFVSQDKKVDGRIKELDNLIVGEIQKHINVIQEIIGDN